MCPIFLRVTFTYKCKVILSVVNREKRLNEETRVEIMETKALGHAVATSGLVSDYRLGSPPTGFV